MLIASAACGSRQNELQTGGQAATTVQVENQAFQDMTIYVLDGTRRIRLGSVPGVSTRIFRIPDRLIFGISRLQFEVDPLASNRTAMSQHIPVSEGEQLRLVIPPNVR